MIKKTVIAVAAMVVPVAVVSSTMAAPGAATALAASPAAPAAHRLCAPATQPGQNSCDAIVRPAPSQPVRTLAAARPFASTPAGYSPANLQSAYATGFLSTYAGANQVAAVVDAYGDPNLESDLAAYRAEWGLPSCTTANGCFKVLNQQGASAPLPAPNAGWASETALDVDMVSAICPLCKLDVVEANSNGNNDLYPAVNAAAAAGAKFISLSWGGLESLSEISADSSYFNHPGVAITASTGDNGYGTQYPAASPNVVAVGGTSLSPAANARGWTESAWSGAGSGCSAYEPKPAFQHDTGCARRAIADVSADADTGTPVAYYDSYAGSPGWLLAGGTSVSAPIIAAVYAIAGLPITNRAAPSIPYQNPGFLWDAVGGSTGSCGNYLCTGVAGYDGPTGLGSPNGTSSFWEPGTSGGKVGYTACSGENSMCLSPHTETVAFGVNGAFNYFVSSGIGCTDGNFGDPAFNSIKACYSIDGNAPTNPAPPGYRFCSAENGVCSVTGTASVAYGANDHFTFVSVSGSVACNNSEFGGDPIVGVAKSCWFQTLTADGGPAGSTLCSAENGTCTFSGSHLVAFGAHGRFSYRTGIGSIGCNASAFGDPVVGVAKQCFVL